MVTLYDEFMVLPARTTDTTDAVEFLTDRMQAARDEAADAEYERRCAAEDAVTFDDLLEEMVSLHDATKAELMLAVASGDSASCAFVWLELSRAMDRVVARLLSEGN